MAERDDIEAGGRIGEAFLEARETLDEADAWGDALFGDPGDPESRNRLVEVVHDIKEACGPLPLPRLEAMAEAATEAADALYERGEVPTPEAMTTILSAIGRMRDILAEVEAGGGEPGGDDALLIGALAVIAGREPPAPVPAPEAGPTADGDASGDAAGAAAGDGGVEGDRRRYVIFRAAAGGPKALEADRVAWMDVVDAVVAGPEGGAAVEVLGRTVRLAALDGAPPAIGPLAAPRPVIVLKAGERRRALVVDEVLGVTVAPAVALSAVAEIVTPERLFEGS